MAGLAGAAGPEMPGSAARRAVVLILVPAYANPGFLSRVCLSRLAPVAEGTLRSCAGQNRRKLGQMKLSVDRRGWT